jgi:putative transposase
VLPARFRTIKIGSTLALAPTMHRKTPPRFKGFDYTGLHQYLLTICTYRRYPIFQETTFALPASEQLRECSEQYSFGVIAYCFMPDHVHVLAGGERDDADFREFVRVWKQRTAFHAKRELHVKLWQRSFHEHVLRKDEITESAARYLLANPVRKGLVASPEEYPYLGSFVTTVRDLMQRAQEMDCAGPT